MAKSKIKNVRARRSWDLRGVAAIEVEVTLRYGARGTAILSAKDTAVDPEARIDQMVRFVNESINGALKGQSVIDFTNVDQQVHALVSGFDGQPGDPDLAYALSQAMICSAAETEKLPLWQYLGTFLGLSSANTLPLPVIDAITCSGQKKPNNLIETLSLVPVGANDYSQALDWCRDIYFKLKSFPIPENSPDDQILQHVLKVMAEHGRSPGQEMALALKIKETDPGNTAPTDLLSGLLVDWVTTRSVVSIETPFPDHDVEAYKRLTWAIGKQAHVFAPSHLIRGSVALPPGHLDQPGNACVVNSIISPLMSTVRDTKDRVNESGALTCLSTTGQGLAGDLAIHLAIGWGIPLIKFGTISDAECLKGWQEGVRIAETIAATASVPLSSKGALPPRSHFAWT